VSTKPGESQAVTVEGNVYPGSVRVANKNVSLVGVGVREVTFMNPDVYTMGVYAETKTCKHSKLVGSIAEAPIITPNEIFAIDPRGLLSACSIRY